MPLPGGPGPGRPFDPGVPRPGDLPSPRPDQPIERPVRPAPGRW